MIALSQDQKDTSAPVAVPVLARVVVAIAAIAMTGWVFDLPGAVAGKAQRDSVVDSCSGGDEVTRFVCRNTWLSHHKLSYR